MIRDNTVVDEGFKWQNKEKLFKIIEQNEKSNVLFLSGDVHFANTYQTACSALTGYNMIEYTSSGMSHTIDSFHVFMVHEFVDMGHDPIYTVERISGAFNFGEVEIDTKERLVHLSMKDDQGNSFFHHTIDLSKDLIFNKTNLGLNRELCVNL
jgi:hypothetical protein